ncbi:putative holin-like toxin [Streptococcus suis]
MSVYEAIDLMINFGIFTGYFKNLYSQVKYFYIRDSF